MSLKRMNKSILRTFKSFSVLKPFVNFEERLKYRDSLKLNVSRRKLDVDVDEICNFHDNLKRLKGVKTRLESSREAVRLEVIKHGNNDGDETAQLKNVAKMIREDHKQMKSSVLELEEKLISLVNRLPNELNRKTEDEDRLIYVTNLPDVSDSHLDIGRSSHLLEYKSPWAYYLMNEAAELETNGFPRLVDKLKSINFVGFSNPDFVRTIVLDGCEGANIDCIPLDKFEGQQDESFLTGGAAILPFLCYFSRHSVTDNDSTVRCYTYGRQYSQKRTVPSLGLFSAVQTNALEIFVLCSPTNEETEFDNLISLITDFYKTLNIPFRILIKRANELNVAESLRVSFELFSPHFRDFFDCGHISLYGSRFSEMMNIRQYGSQDCFQHVIGGTVISIAPLVAALLENGEFTK